MMTNQRTPATARRRRVSRVIATCAATCTSIVLAACAGGEAPPPAAPVQPALAIQEFAAERAAYSVGDVATLRVRFTGGDGRIEPRIGAVQSGVPVPTPVLGGPAEFTLIVESPAGRVTRRLALPVEFRDRYRVVESRFSAVGHTATLATDGSVILVGGYRGGNFWSAAIDRFDPATRQFSRIGSLQAPRQGHRVTRLDDGRMLVTGGDRYDTERPAAELIDPRTGAVTPAGRPVRPRDDHEATLLRDGRVLVTGGYASGESAPGSISSSAELWDPRTGEFRLLSRTMTAPRAAHTAAQLVDGRVLIVGGLTSRAEYALAEIFDPVTETFTPLPTPDSRVRFGHVMITLLDGSVLVLGGQLRDESLDASVLHFAADGSSARALAPLSVPRTEAIAALGRNDRVYLVGGRVEAGRATATAEAYAATAGGFALAAMPEPRYRHTVTRLPDGRLLIAGGENQTSWLLPNALLYE